MLALPGSASATKTRVSERQKTDPLIFTRFLETLQWRGLRYP
jgi:hypothetical protein